MEPNNFEKDFREKLNQREIEPSSKAWDRLDAMLSVAEEKQPKTYVSEKKWLYIAASIIGFLLLGTFFFNQEKNIEIPKNKVVIEENSQKDSVAKPELKPIKAVQQEIVIAEKQPVQDTEKAIKNEKALNIKSTKNLNNANQIAESSVISQKNQQSQSNNNPVSVPETPIKETTEQLLTAAEKSVVAENPVKPKAKIKINASDLLHQVDGELELSFREKVISKINKNYQTAKVTLENRNKQE